MLSNTLDLCEFILFDLSALCFRIAAVYSFTVFGTICPHLVIVCFLRRKLLIYIRNSASLFNRWYCLIFTGFGCGTVYYIPFGTAYLFPFQCSLFLTGSYCDSRGFRFYCLCRSWCRCNSIGCYREVFVITAFNSTAPFGGNSLYTVIIRSWRRNRGICIGEVFDRSNLCEFALTHLTS